MFEKEVTMEKTTMSRRTFTKCAAALGAVAALGMGVSSDLVKADPARAEEADEEQIIKTSCRACIASCAVLAHVKNGRVIRIEGNPESPMSMGGVCAKGMAGIQALYHPNRNKYPMCRVGERGGNDWERISWDEAYGTIAEKFHEFMDKYGGESMFFMGGTSRIWTQHAYAAWLQMVGTPNAVTAWQICKGPRHMATEMVSEYAYSWMATTDRPRVFVSWGGASEISNYDESCRTTVDLAKTADTYISVDPRMTNLGHEADIHMYLKPGTDGALALAWTDVVIENKLYNDLYVKRWTDAPFLVVDGMEPSGGVPIDHKIEWTSGKPMATRLLKECDLKEGGSPQRFMVWDELAGTDADHPLHENDPSGHLTYFDAQTGLWENEPDVVWDKFYDNPQPNLPKGTVPGRIAEQSPFDPEIDPAIYGEFEVTLKDGKTYQMKPVWEHYAARAHEFTPEVAAEITGISADDIRNAALTWATPIDPSTGYGNGGLQYMLAAEHACNAIQNNRALDNLCGITGNFDTPAGMRGPSCGLFKRMDDLQPLLAAEHG